MRIFIFCLLVLALDVAFALASAFQVRISGALSGMPVSLAAGAVGIVILVIFAFVSVLLVAGREKAK